MLRCDANCTLITVVLQRCCQGAQGMYSSLVLTCFRPLYRSNTNQRRRCCNCVSISPWYYHSSGAWGRNCPRFVCVAVDDVKESCACVALCSEASLRAIARDGSSFPCCAIICVFRVVPFPSQHDRRRKLQHWRKAVVDYNRVSILRGDFPWHTC